MRCCSVPAACPEYTVAWWPRSPGLQRGPRDLGTMCARPRTASGALTLYTCPPVSSHLNPEGCFLLPSNCGQALVQETQQTSLPSSGLQPQLLQGGLNSSHGGGPLSSLFLLVSTPLAFDFSLHLYGYSNQSLIIPYITYILFLFKLLCGLCLPIGPQLIPPLHTKWRPWLWGLQR